MTALPPTLATDPTLTRPTPGNGRILLADHDALFREATAELLRARGYACACAASADAALERLNFEPFDLLLADTHLPGNRDLEMVRSLPQAAAGPSVILLTGTPTVETAAESVRLSVVAYLIKPPNMDELCALADRAIIQSRACRAVDTHHQRIRAWCRDLEQLKGLIRRPAPQGHLPLWQSFLTISLGHIIESLVELKDYTEALVQAPTPSAPLSSLDSSRPLVLVNAIREAVHVLERSKGAFKSRELGDLRKKLEALVDGR